MDSAAKSRLPFLLHSVMLDNSPPPATRDELPADAAMRRHLDGAFARNAEAYGFEEVATPVFERADLFTARSGPEIKNSLLTFHCDHEEYALRPELTAPVCRLVASGALEGFHRPYKLFYVGPCFRYCRPHSGRSRQFTQAGFEVLGDPSPQADAEVIAAALRFLRSIGIDELRLTVGTAGIFRSLLPVELNPDERATVIGHLDRLSGIRERCATLAATKDPLTVEQLRTDRRDLASLQARDGYTGEFAIADLPAPDPAQLARRLPEEAAATFRRIWNVEGYLPDETAELLIRASGIRGTLDEVSKLAATVLGSSSAGESLAELMEVCQVLGHYGIDGFDVSLGIARGLTFYTGLVFEISSEQGMLCGGGRYDRLVELFGGDPTPATGCGVRFDTLQQLLSTRDRTAAFRGIRLAAAGPGDKAHAVRLAEDLRDSGARVGVAGAPMATLEAGTVRLPGGIEVKADADSVLRALAEAARDSQPAGKESA